MASDVSKQRVTYKYDEHGFPHPTYHCQCGEITEGFIICLKCNPIKYEVIEMKPRPTKSIWIGYHDKRIVGIWWVGCDKWKSYWDWREAILTIQSEAEFKRVRVEI